MISKSVFGVVVWAVFFFVLPGMASPAPKHARYALKFDLICQGLKKIAYKPYRPEVGLGPAYSEGAVGLHYPVDLTTMEYCADHRCSGFHRKKIDFMRGDRIVFHDGDNTGFETVNLTTMQYDSVVQEVEGVVWSVKAKCRLAPFSGV